MDEHSAMYWRRVLRAQRCTCSEFPQVYHHSERGTVWFVCSCGKISKEAQDIGRAILNWNNLNTWGDDV